MNLPRVLIVDDSIVNLRLLAFVLKNHAFDVATAENAEEALVQVAASRPSVILMDLQLPGMDGLTLTRRLKADPLTRDIIIVAVTAYAMMGDEAEARAAGCDDYVTKPIDTRTLPERILRLVAPPSFEPRDPRPVSTAQGPASHRVGLRAEGPRILVVDDNAMTRRLVALALNRAGFGVVEAHDAVTALAAFSHQDVSLVLLDLVLADVDGFELVRRMRALPRGPEVPMLAFSGLLSGQDGARVTAAGFDDIVVKPIEPLRLVEIVRSHLPREAGHTEPFGQGRHLVIADDDPVQRKLVAFRVAKAGFTVSLAADGDEALLRARERVPDAVVSDVLMPRLDGFGLCLAMARDATLAHVPVVLATNSYVEPIDKELAYKVGAQELVVRTPELAELLGVLKSCLETGRTRAAPASNRDTDIIEREHHDRVAAQLERHLIINTRLGQRNALLSAEVSVIGGMTEALAAQEDIDEALAMTLSACFDAGQISLGGLVLTGPEGSRVLMAQGAPSSLAAELASVLRNTSLLTELEARGTLTLSRQDPRVRGLMETTTAMGGVLAPLVHKGRRFGALLMLGRGDDIEFSERRAFAEAVAAQVSQALALTESFRQRSESERQAREQSTLLASILESIGDGVVVVDGAGNVIRANAPGQPLIALLTRQASANEPLGFFGGDRLTPLDPDASPIQRALRGELVDSVEVFARLGQGHERWYNVSACPWLRGRQPAGAVAVFRDVTQDKATQSHLITSDRMASVGLLAAGVAHEINNPLASALTNLEVAHKDCLPRLEAGDRSALAELDEALGDARQAAERVRHIVRDLKIFSRHEQEAEGVSDIHAVLESTLRMANNEVRHRAKLVKDFGPDALVRGSESRLGQVFLNLIVNAAQAIPDGAAERHTLTVATRQQGDRVLVTVSDTGVGIAPEALTQVFLPFFTTKAPGHGTGLGLAISHSIVTRLGGEIRVESRLGAGTTFTVELAVASAVKRPDRITNGHVARNVPRGRVLVIDDEPLIGESIRRLLSRSHDVLPLTDAREALARFERGERFDVVLCDLMMPQMTGIELHAALARIDPGLADGLVFLTGGAFTPAARTFLDTIANSRLNKPFAAHELRRLVDERVLRAQEPERAAHAHDALT